MNFCEELLKPGGECKLREDMMELFLPSEDWANGVAEIICAYGYADVIQLCTALRKFLVSKRLFVTVGGVAHKLPEMLDKIIHKRSSVSDNDGRSLLMVFLGDTRNVKMFFDSLPADERRLMEESVKSVFVSEQCVKQFIGKSAIVGPRTDYPETVPEMNMFWCSTLPEVSYGRKQPNRYVFGLNPILRHSLLPVVFSDLFECDDMDVLPEEEKLKTFCGESEIFPLMGVMDKAFKANTLSLNKTDGKVSAVKMRSFLAKTRIGEFFSSSPFSSDLTLRAQLMLNAYLQFLVYEDLNHEEPHDDIQRLKKLFGTGLICENEMLGIMLNHLEIYVQIFDTKSKFIMACIADSLLSADIGRWIRLDKVMVMSRYASPNDDACIIYYRTMWDRLLLRNVRTGDVIDALSLYSHLAVPFVEAYLFLLAAFGFVEVAYRDPEDGDVSSFSGLRYVRLTKLGAYAMGVEKTYSPPAFDREMLFEADSDNLIIRSLEAGSIYESLLEDIAERISSTRFRVTHASFLQSCHNVNDIKDRIETFRRMVCPEPPEIWRRFFEEVEANASLVTKHKSERYVMWKVSPSDAELTRIVTTDPFIRKHTVKVENFTLLVEKRHVASIKEKLKAYGYLMD